MKRLLVMIGAFSGGSSMVLQSRINGAPGAQTGSGYMAGFISFAGIGDPPVSAAVNRHTHSGIRRTVSALRSRVTPWSYLIGGNEQIGDQIWLVDHRSLADVSRSLLPAPDSVPVAAVVRKMRADEHHRRVSPSPARCACRIACPRTIPVRLLGACKLLGSSKQFSQRFRLCSGNPWLSWRAGRPSRAAPSGAIA